MPRKNKTNKSHSQHPILDGTALIYKRESSGNVWQFRMYVSNEHKDYRVSLRARDFESAVEKGCNLARLLNKIQIMIALLLPTRIFNRLVGKTP